MALVPRAMSLRQFEKLLPKLFSLVGLLIGGELADNSFKKLRTIRESSLVRRHRDLDLIVKSDQRNTWIAGVLWACHRSYPVDLAALENPRLLQTASHARHDKVHVRVVHLNSFNHGLLWQELAKSHSNVLEEVEQLIMLFKELPKLLRTLAVGL